MELRWALFFFLIEGEDEVDAPVPKVRIFFSLSEHLTSRSLEKPLNQPFFLGFSFYSDGARIFSCEISHKDFTDVCDVESASRLMYSVGAVPVIRW